MLALDYQAFDQNTPWGGWRGVGRHVECASAAGDLIAAYRGRHEETLSVGQRRILDWHEGQMRAKGGEYDRAATLFEAAKHLAPEDGYDEAWNFYADASSAFVRRDREALDAAFDAMMALPLPDDWEAYSAAVVEMLGREPRWPNNIEVVEQLRDCFDATYDEAYGDGC